MMSRALRDNRRLRLATFAILYAAQGIPDAMVLILFPAYLAANGAAAGVIGTFLATAMLPNAAKLLVGPLIDRHAFLPMGRRKPWLMAGQVGIALSFAALALLNDPVSHIGWFTAGAFAITLATVFQDVATDATAMDLVPPLEQGRANSIMWGSKTLGTAGVASLGAAILVMFGFAVLVLAAAASLLAVFCILAMVRERPGERLLPWTRGAAPADTFSNRVTDWWSILGQLNRALRKRPAWRLLVLSLAIGLLVGMTGALAPVLMVKDFGWAQTDYAQFRSLLKLVAGLIGMLVGGLAIDRLGHGKVLVSSLLAIALVNLSLASFFSERGAITYLALYEMLVVFTFTTFFAATMSQCGRAIAATQFSVTMVCGNLTMSLGAALLGPIVSIGGSAAMLLAISAVAVGGAIVMVGWRAEAA